MWMKHERSLISVMHGEFTNSWNDVSDENEANKVFPLKMNRLPEKNVTNISTYDYIQDHERSWIQRVSLAVTDRPAS